MMTTQNHLDAIAEAYGVNLRIDHDESAPFAYAVWCNVPEADDDEDIIGAGATPGEALEEARATLLSWESQ